MQTTEAKRQLDHQAKKKKKKDKKGAASRFQVGNKEQSLQGVNVCLFVCFSL